MQSGMLEPLPQRGLPFPSMRIALALGVIAFAMGGCGFELDLSSTNPLVDAPPEAITMCTAGQPLCIGRVRATCNATGTGIAETTLCPLACLDGGQCVAASNLPDDAQRACLSSAPTLSPPNNAMVQFRPGGSPGGVDIRCTPNCGGGVSTISSSRVSQASGPPIAMFCLRTIDLPASVTVTSDLAVTNALALLVVGNVQIAGKLLVSGSNAGQNTGGQGGPAGGDGGGPAGDDSSGSPGGPPCGGNGGSTVGTNASAAGGGGGGGGHAAKGGDGGQGRADANLAAGGSGGNACGAAELSPLAGGGGGGAGGDGSCHPTTCGWAGGGGGGAIQISATGSFVLAGTSAIRASGGTGFGATTGEAGEGGGGGGGAGGAILLEAPAMTIGGVLDVIGGNGGQSNAGAGGTGGSSMLAGGAGAIQDALREGGGGGGGAGGRIRVNASNASCGTAAQPPQACTTGTLRVVP